MKVVKCKAGAPDKDDCPMMPYCLVRLTDHTITGCGLPLYMMGVILKKSDILVEYSVRMDDSTPKHGTHRKGAHK